MLSGYASLGRLGQESVAEMGEEADFQKACIDAAHIYGWIVAHFRPARTATGWRTAVQADGAGFPDLVLVHHRQKRVLFVEVKAQAKYLSLDQKMWASALTSTRAEWDLWKPNDWERILRILGGTSVSESATSEK